MNDLNNYVTSLIRTYTPILVGIAATQLLRLGVEVDTTSAVLVLSGLLSGLWYAAVRWAERRWPRVGWLLGRPVQPSYLEGGVNNA